MALASDSPLRPGKGGIHCSFLGTSSGFRESMVLSPGSQGSGSASQAAPFLFTFMRRTITLDSDKVDLETKTSNAMIKTRVTE